MNQKTTLLTYSALMCALIIVSTLWLKFSIPGTDMLVTTQVFFVLLCGHLLPPRYCLYTLGLYLAIGLAGVPVFSAMAGPAVILTPSFGYLLSFPLSAMTVAAVVRRYPQKYMGYAASVLGVVVEYAVAVSYMALLRFVLAPSDVPFSHMISAYCLAFVPVDLAKGLLAAALGGRLRKILRIA